MRSTCMGRRTCKQVGVGGEAQDAAPAPAGHLSMCRPQQLQA